MNTSLKISPHKQRSKALRLFLYNFRRAVRLLANQYGFLSIGKKITLLVFLFALLFLAEVGITNWGYGIVIGEVAKLQEAQEAQKATAKIQTLALEARTLEKEFFLRPGLETKERFLEKLQAAENAAERLTLSGVTPQVEAHLAQPTVEAEEELTSVFDENFDPASEKPSIPAPEKTAPSKELPPLSPKEEEVLKFLQANQGVRQILSEYRQSFEQVFSLNENMGFDFASGYRGRFMESAARIEAELKRLKLKGLLEQFHLLRNQEKDYFLGDASAGKRVGKSAELLRARLTRRLGSDHPLVRPAGLLDGYLSNFDRVRTYTMKAFEMSEQFQEDFLRLPQLLQTLDEVTLQRQMMIGSRANKVMAQIRARLLWGGLIALALIFLVSWALSYSIIEPIRQVFALTRKLSQGDLAIRLNDRRRDEVGAMSKGFNGFIVYLRGMIQTIHQNTANLSTAAVELAATTSEIEKTTQGVNQGVDHSHHSLQTTAQNIDVLAETIRGITHEIVELRNSTQAVETKTQLGQQTMLSAQQAMGEIESSSHLIGKIVYQIKTISQQISMFSFNTAIEAARAGNAGKGFQVLAAEVRRLAEASHESSEEIGLLAAGSQEKVLLGKEVVEVAQNQFSEITLDVSGIRQRLDRMSQSLIQQDQKTQSLAQETQLIRSISKENSEAMMGLAIAIRQVDQTTTELTKMADFLHSKVQVFKL